MASAQQTVQTLLAKADIQINGSHPWDIKVLDDRFYKRVLVDGSLGLGESYMDGWWESEDVAETIAHITRANLQNEVQSLSVYWAFLKAKLWNLQSKGRKAQEVVDTHYDLGNDLYTRMLDPRMVYTCGFWQGTKNLAQAQEAKLDLVCKKIGLKKGDKVLDIGCGFGSFCKFAAEKYGAITTGITLSKEQKKYADESCKGLPVEIRIQDYRDLHEQFDHIVSIGMFEAVGLKNFREYFTVANRCLKDTGLFLLHTIGGNRSVNRGDPWSDKYIFKNGMLPSAAQLGKAIEGKFVMEDWHNFGVSYDKTLLAWYENFNANWDDIKEKYGDRFHRMWKYYLLSFAGAFRSRSIQLWQVVLSKNGVEGGYIRPVL